MSTEKDQKKQETTTTLPQAPLADEVAEDLHPLLLWLTKNIKTITIAALAVVLVFGSLAAYEYYQRQSRVSAANELGKILVTTDAAKKLQELEAYVKSAPASMETRGLFELATVSIKDKDFAQADKTWTQLHGKVDATLQTVPTLGRVQALTMQGETEEAIRVLKDLKKTGPKAYAPSVNRMLAALAEQAGDYATALEAYETLLAVENGQERMRAYFTHKISELSQKTEKKKS